MRKHWEKLSPKYRQATIYAAALGGVLLLAFLFVTTGTKQTAREEKVVKREVFTPSRLETKFGIPGLARELEDLKRDNKELKSKIDQLLKTGVSRQEPDKKALQDQVDKLVERRLQEVRPKDLKEQKVPDGKPAPPEGGKSAQAKGPSPQGRKVQTPGWLPAQAKTEGKPPGPSSAPGTPLSGSHAKEIRVISAVDSARESGPGGQKGAAHPRKEKAKEDKGTFIPAGSIFSGTLLTGMDAPCGEGARKDPFPALLRVKKEAIMPNRYTADVRECFLVASGYGDLSSERAYLRSERLSCIRQDGKALETRIEMYAVGEDGKAGVRGRLVSKQGTIIGRALLVGFMEGFSKMFGKTPVLTIDTGQRGIPSTTPFQRNLSQDSLEAAGIAGVGNALDRLAKYYLDMAQNIFPIVEIDAGRQVDFVLISGASLKLQGKP